MSRPYIWEIKFPTEQTITIDYAVTFPADTWVQVPVSWGGAGVVTYIQSMLDQGLVAYIKDLDGVENPLDKDLLYRMYRSLLSISGKI